jgi:hypothetical protein
MPERRARKRDRGRRMRERRRTHVSMYADVGRSGGSHPILILSGCWYTRTQSMRIVAGKLRFSTSTYPNAFEMPRFARMYCSPFGQRHIIYTGCEGIGTRTIGSSGIGRAEIPVSRSAPMPAALSVHVTSLFVIQVMYCERRPISIKTNARRKGTYGVIVPRHVLEAVHGVAPASELIAALVCQNHTM